MLPSTVWHRSGATSLIKVWEAIKGTYHFDAESDEELEAELRRELIGIARLNGMSDPETLKGILLASMPSCSPRSDASRLS